MKKDITSEITITQEAPEEKKVPENNVINVDNDKWEEYVRSTINSLMDLYLPEANNGNVFIKYNYKELERKEGESVKHDKSKATGVGIILTLDFENTIDVSDS